ncbi:MAG TPA: hypothetical protein VMP01_12195 [Pirellulaceae bacterium]|nr:hypothetical protein [Pirellulaceae bacterium]
MRDEEAIVAISAILLIFGMPIVWLVLHYCHATAKVFFETRLKRDMVARGFSAQEIVQVVHCRPAKKGDVYQAHGIPPAKPIRQPELQSN